MSPDVGAGVGSEQGVTGPTARSILAPTGWRDMRKVSGLVALIGLGWAAMASAQEARPPDIGLTLTEALRLNSPAALTRDDYREVPPPRNDRLSDNVRITVTVGSPQCFPGEDGIVPPPRSATGSPPPARFR